MNSLSFISILIIALGLSADCFAVSFGSSCSLKKLSWLPVLRVCLAFGIFQALMPTLGWLLGNTFVKLIQPYDHWIAFGLLAVIGGRMLWEFSHREKETQKEVDFTRGLPLLMLSIATSIDALAAGLSFALLKVNMAIAAATIGIVAFVVTGIGFTAGRKASHLLGRWAELAGGLILIGIGLRILLTHLLAS